MLMTFFACPMVFAPLALAFTVDRDFQFVAMRAASIAAILAADLAFGEDRHRGDDAAARASAPVDRAGAPFARQAMTAGAPRWWRALAQIASIASAGALPEMPPRPGSGSWSARPRPDTTAGRVAFSWLRPIRIRCLLVGHDDYLLREPHRLLLRCGECDRRTPGWPIGMSPPRITAAARPRAVAIIAPRVSMLRPGR